MRKLRLIGMAGLTAAAFAIPSATIATAENVVFHCPGQFEPVPTQALPPGALKDRDRNTNGIVCAKGPMGANQHYNVKDDKGQVVPPTTWSAQPVSQNTWLVTMALDPLSTYTLDPVPTEAVDDTLTP